MQRVLVLGAGLVAKPLVRYLLEKGYQVNVASRTVSKAERMIANHPNGKAQTLHLKDEDQLVSAIKESDLTVSLVPFVFHPVVARHCINNRKHMVTTSYVSEAMQGLDHEARSAGIAILNEIGVDPGIDHMSTMRIIDSVKARGGRILSFKSYCGGLPAPADNDNPFDTNSPGPPEASYWPEPTVPAIFLTGMRSRYRRIGYSGICIFWRSRTTATTRPTPIEIPLATSRFMDYRAFAPCFAGPCATWVGVLVFNSYGKMGLFSLDEIDVRGETYAGFTRRLLDIGSNEDLGVETARQLQIPKESLPILNLEWLGLFS